ncbi:MAG: MFS transporter [Thermoplasmata archaeon]
MRNFYPLFIASSAFFFSYFGRLSWSILSVYTPFHVSIAEEAYVFSLFFIGYIIVQIPSGIISDRISGGLVIVIALFGLSIATFLSGHATNISEEYVASVLMGLTAGWIYPASINVMHAYYSDNVNLYIGYYSIAWPLAIVMAGILLPFVVKTYGWEWGYYLSSISTAVLAVLSIPLRKFKAKSRKINFSLFTDRNVILISIGGFIFFLSYWSLTLYAYKYFISIGINDYIAGIIYSSMAIAGLVSTVLSGYIMNRVGSKRSAVISLIAYGLLMLPFAFFRNALLFMFVALFMGFFRFIVTPANSSLITSIGRENSGSASGIANLVWQTSGIVGPVFASAVIYNVGFKYLWLVLLITILASSVFYQSIKIQSVQKTI